jgi:hypothetical protein
LRLLWRRGWGVGIPEIVVAMLPDNIELLLRGPDNFTVFPLWGRWVVVMSYCKGAMVISTACLIGAINSRRSNVLVESITTLTITLVSGALCWVAIALAARVVSRNSGFFVDYLG